MKHPVYCYRLKEVCIKLVTWKKSNYLSFYAILHDLWRKYDEELSSDDDDDDDDDDLGQPLPTNGQYM